MPHLLEKRLAYLSKHGETEALRRVRIGLEREALRVSPEGRLSQRPHPYALGSALTHPQITTDYSEALLEFVTPPLTTPEDALQRLDTIQHVAAQQLGDEMLWNASMPCHLDGEDGIPIAQYGASNLAKFKHIYRVGLAHRYGKAMQTIAGIHYNFSFAEETWPVWLAVDGVRADSADDIQAFRSRRYLDLLRNIQRYGFVIPYLFGASPAVSRSFFTTGNTKVSAHLPRLDDDTCYLPRGTSLRLSDLGYSNRKCPFFVSSDSLDAYLFALYQATHTPCETFEKVGVMVDGAYRQLNANILQIENEYYSSVRPKQPPQAGETPSRALRQRGIAYLELRSLDVSPFTPTGTDLETMRFIQAWLTTCFLLHSDSSGRRTRIVYDSNLLGVAANGRSDEAILDIDGEPKTLAQALTPLLDQIEMVSEWLGEPYRDSVRKQRGKIADPETTPSARMLREMREQQESFHALACRYSKQHADRYRETPLPTDVRGAFETMAETSRQEQQRLEAADQMNFDDYLARYLADAAQMP
ncbi:MAG: glutamate--cysteine ligase [Proteobacteria bacterium]|nr:glutamate--cysteine ligase [Pseudomonadota bacterium]MCL2306650.1 glutamate--cysteine ligase [Pseudomonadota bacterium]